MEQIPRHLYRPGRHVPRRVREQALFRRRQAPHRRAVRHGHDPEAFHALLDERYDGYREWALKFMCEAPEAMLWTRWLTPGIRPQPTSSATPPS